MRNQRERENSTRRSLEGTVRSVAVAIDRDKSSQQALKWAVDHVITRNQIVKLIHVNQRQRPSLSSSPGRIIDSLDERNKDSQIMEVFLPFRVFCMRRQVQCEVVVLENLDAAKGIVEYVSRCGVELLFLGNSSKMSFSRLFKNADTPSSVLKSAPDFCSVYVVGKEDKLISVRSASRPLPAGFECDSLQPSTQSRMYDELSACDNDMSSGRPSTESSCLSFYENLGSRRRMDDPSFYADLGTGTRGNDTTEFNAVEDQDNTEGCVWPPHNAEIMEGDIRRLTVELQRTMDMYHAACKEAITAKQTVVELRKCKVEREKKLQQAQQAEKEALAALEEERAKYNDMFRLSHQSMIDQELNVKLSAKLRAIEEAKKSAKISDPSTCSNETQEYRSLFHISVVLMFLYVYFMFS